MDWFSLSLLAGLAFAASRVIARFVLRKEGNALAFTAVHDFIAGLVLLPFIIINFHLPEQPITWLFFFGVVVFAFLADWLAFLALKLIDVSLYQIINQVRHIFILFGGLVLFSEMITGAKVASIVLIIVGVAIALYEKSKFKFSKGILLTAGSTLAAVIAFLFVKAAVTDFSETALASFELMLVGLLSFSLLRFRPKPLLAEIKRQKWGLVIAGALFGIFELLLFLALGAGEASKVIPVTQSSLVFTVLAGILLLKERERLAQKLFGTVVIAVGIVLLYVM